MTTQLGWECHSFCILEEKLFPRNSLTMLTEFLEFQGMKHKCQRLKVIIALSLFKKRKKEKDKGEKIRKQREKVCLDSERNWLAD